MKTSFNREENSLVESIEINAMSWRIALAVSDELNRFVAQLDTINTIEAYTAWIKEWRVYQRMLASAGRFANLRRAQTRGTHAMGFNFIKLQIRPIARVCYEARVEGKAKARSGAFIDVVKQDRVLEDA